MQGGEATAKQPGRISEDLGQDSTGAAADTNQQVGNACGNCRLEPDPH